MFFSSHPLLPFTLEKRCKSEEVGCCTTDNPCDEGDGVCSDDAQCSGHMTCGTNNCPWSTGGGNCCEKGASSCHL